MTAQPLPHTTAAPFDDPSLTEDSIAALVERARGDDAAFAQLYSLHVDGVYRYLCTYTENPDDARDLTHHVFVRVLEALPSYRSRGAPFRAWLFRIARNAATDAFRRRRRAIPWDHVPESLHPISSTDPQEAVLVADTLNQLRVLVSRLSPADQEMLALRFAGDLSAREIGALVGKSEAATQKQITRLLHRMKGQMYGNEA